MPELVADVRVVQEGKFVEVGDKFTVDDENAEKLIAEGSASKPSTSRAKTEKE